MEKATEVTPPPAVAAGFVVRGRVVVGAAVVGRAVVGRELGGVVVAVLVGCGDRRLGDRFGAVAPDVLVVVVGDRLVSRVTVMGRPKGMGSHTQAATTAPVTTSAVPPASNARPPRLREAARAGLYPWGMPTLIRSHGEGLCGVHGDGRCRVGVRSCLGGFRWGLGPYPVGGFRRVRARLGRKGSVRAWAGVGWAGRPGRLRTRGEGRRWGRRLGR